MKVFIHSVPKAGTYFLAELVRQLGFTHTGRHVFPNWTTHTDPDIEGRMAPTTRINQGFVRVLQDLPDQSLAYGHVAAPLQWTALPDFRFLCAYRDPRAALVAEFIDFRFLRDDLPRYRPSVIADDREAFEVYLQFRGPGMRLEFIKVVAVAVLAADPCLGQELQHRTIFVNFEDARRDAAEVARIGRFFGRTLRPDDATALLSQVRATKTRTESAGVSIDRDALWTRRAENLYAGLDFTSAIERGRQLGWTI